MPPDYGGRTPAQQAWLIGAAGLVLVMVVGGGWLAWRGLAAGAPPLSGSPSNDSSAVPAAQVAFGAPHVANGVPWGYPLTPDGAAAAAVTAVAVTGQSDAVFNPDRFAEVATVVFTPDQAQQQARQVDAARTEFEVSGWGQQPLSRRMYHFAPLAVRLAAYDPAGPTAKVEVWAMTLVGVGDAGGAVFTTSTVDLATNDASRTWIVTSLESVEGPTPLVHEAASTPGRTRALVRDAAATLPLPIGLSP